MVLTGEICFGLEVFLREENETGWCAQSRAKWVRGPQWDDPNGQLPGVVPERPSLFSTSGSSSFNPFSAALSSLRPEERAEVNRTGVSDALQRYANQEMQRLFAEHLRSLPPEPVSSSFDPFGISSRVVSAGETAQGSGVAGGTSQVFHIGTPSGSENTGSSLFQSIPSQRSSIPSHPTSSPVSFGPSTPVMSASAAPAGLLSSPGGMSDVGGTLNSTRTSFE